MNTQKSIKICRDELLRTLALQSKLLDYMKENNIVPKHNPDKPLIIDSKNIVNMQSLLKNESIKLENFDAVISFVGTMKAGKSTIINTIIGKKVLPSRNTAMTALPTLICHEKGRDLPKLELKADKANKILIYLRKLFKGYPNLEKLPKLGEIVQPKNDIFSKLKEDINFKKEVEGTDIVNELSAFNDLFRIIGILGEKQKIPEDEIKDFYSSYQNVDELPIIYVAFQPLKENTANTDGRIILLDTPGPNEAGQHQLKNIITEQLQRSSAVALILNYTSLGTNDEAELRAQVDSIPTVKPERLYAIVNKFDQSAMDSSSLDEEETKYKVVNELLEEKIQKEHVFPTSAIKAFAAQQIINTIEITDDWPDLNISDHRDNLRVIYNTGNIEKKRKKIPLEELKDDVQDVLEESLIEPLLKELIQKAYNEAPKIAMESALSNCQETFKDLDNVFAINGAFANEDKLTEQQLQKIKDSLEKLSTLRNDLEDKSKKANDEIKNISKEISEDAEKKVDQIKKRFERDIEDLKEESRKTNRDQSENAKKKMRFNWEYVWRLRSSSEQDDLRKKKALEGKVKDIGENELAFFGKKDLENHKQAIIEAYDEIVERMNNEAKAIIKEADEKVTKELEQFKIEYQSTVDDIKKEFSAQNIRIQAPDLSIDDLRPVEQEVKLSFGNEQDVKTDTIDKDWYWAPLRWLDFWEQSWGKEKVEYFIIKNDEVFKMLNEQFSEEIASPLVKQCLNIFGKYSANLLCAYTREIELKTEMLINELDEKIKNESKSEQELKRIKTLYKEVVIKYKEIKNSMEDIITFLKN